MPDNTPVCVDPTAPTVKCCICGADIYTCEREEPLDGWDYRCPKHSDGVEVHAGEWVCSDACGERLSARYSATHDMYAALESVEAWVLSEVQPHVDGLPAFMVRLRAALANARGESDAK